MSGVASLLREMHALDASAGQTTALTQFDPRALLLATLAFILVVVSFPRYAVASLLPLALFPVVLARLGQISLTHIGRKLLPALSFALMVGIFNPLFDPQPRLVLLGMPIAGGWLSLTSILLRAIFTVAAALILIACLGMPRLCAALGQLGVPRVMTTQLLLLHRYLHVLAGELGRMTLARELRALSARAMPLVVYGSLLGHLLLRTLERAQRIHQAMLARGFSGEFPQLRRAAWRGRDTALLTLALASLWLLRTHDLPVLLGHLLLGRAG